MPSGFVRKSASPGRAPLLRQSPSGWTVPTTARPYFGSSSRIVCPPARTAPASGTLAAAASKIARTVSSGSSSGNAATESARSGLPPIAKTSLRAFAAATAPNSAGSSTIGGKKSDGEDQRPLVVELVDRGVVGRGEPDEQILRRRRRESGQQLLQTGRGVLGGAAAAGLETGEPGSSLHAMEVTAERPEAY